MTVNFYSTKLSSKLGKTVEFLHDLKWLSTKIGVSETMAASKLTCKLAKTFISSKNHPEIKEI